MAKPSKKQSIELTECSRLKPELAAQSQPSNVSVFTAKYDGNEFLVTMTNLSKPVVGINAARHGQPWSRIGQVFQWRSKKPGNAALKTEDGEYAGLMLHHNVSKYHAEFDTRPARQAMTVVAEDDGMPF